MLLKYIATKNHPNDAKLTALIYDARGNGEGGVSPTITGDHQNRITDYTAIILEIIHEDESNDNDDVCRILHGTFSKVERDWVSTRNIPNSEGGGDSRSPH